MFVKSEGLALDVFDLLSRLKSFLSAQGWTINDESMTTLQIQRGSNRFYSLRAFNNTWPGDPETEFPIAGIAIRGATGFDLAGGFSGQPGRPDDDNDMMLLPYASKYVFLDDGYSCWVATEVASGFWQHFCFGRIISSWQTSFFGGSLKMSDGVASILDQTNVPLASASNGTTCFVLNEHTGGWAKWFNSDAQVGDLATGHGLNSSFYGFPNYSLNNSDGILARARSAFTGITMLVPIQMFGGQGGKWRYIGSLQYAFIVNMRELFAERTYTVGSKQYYVLPFGKKPEPFNHDSTAGKGLGIALRIV
ncbi:hypothetical protein [Pseudomonas koreensis]|uniref:hypothetical protein n=1 Tax=Pseudomonas koreensis TaxID=198620 RepID=UPI002076F232|nr:hypothetical protein [Pseudomonas koreensis]MCM8742337.1 hypothetical protein [Pseudomonas koreensis]